MPFEQFTPRRFTTDGIRAFAPAEAGVYGISNAREWLYIGVSENIQGALLNHLDDRHTTLMKREPTGFVFEVCSQGRGPGRQDRLILEYEPTCNRNSTRHG
jgi:hypothetical protein